MSTGHSSPFVNQHIGTYQERGLFSVTGAHLHPPLSDVHRTSFTFTGKERDEETGYGYFSFSPLDFTSFVIPSGTLSKVHRTFFTRYMDADLFTDWLSVDPMADKYPSLSPYNYCAWNPIKLVDPNGMRPGDPLKNMQVRRNSVSNTFGLVRKNSDGTPRCHQGIDYYAVSGTPILAVKTGKIVNIGDQGDYGRTITLEFTQDDGSVAWAFYAHLSSIQVEIGQVVQESEEIGKTGTSGNASGMKGLDQHLHFEFRTGGILLGKGLEGREDPNQIVDTQFETNPCDPNTVRKVQNLPTAVPPIDSSLEGLNK